jgi:hemin uptake protein HemP
MPAGAAVHGQARANRKLWQRLPAPAQGGSAADAKPLRWTSQQLLGSQPEAQIAHAGTLYRLRLTALGKLILTK